MIGHVDDDHDDVDHRIRCDSVDVDANGEQVCLHCTCLEPEGKPPKGAVQWVAVSTAVPAEVRVYSHLFSVEEPTDENWEAELNPHSEVVHANAFVDASIMARNPKPEDRFQVMTVSWMMMSLLMMIMMMVMMIRINNNELGGRDNDDGDDELGSDDNDDDNNNDYDNNDDDNDNYSELGGDDINNHDNDKYNKLGGDDGDGYVVQFERVGYFVVDKDTTKAGKLVFNMTVSLKDSRPKTASATGTATRSRKEEQAKQLADKMAKMSVAPELMFLDQTDLYSKFDADGVPTHDQNGEPISKSMYKKLKKDWEKQKRLYESAKK